jgi:hypothetical protein
MDMVERHITVGFVLKDQLLLSLKLTTMRSWKGSLNCNIIASRIKYFYLNAIGMTTDRGIRVDLHHGLVKINSKARLRNINDFFIFVKQC